MSFYDTDIDTRRISFDLGDYYGTAVFIPRCKCGRFVKPDDAIWVSDSGLSERTNATCKRCGPTHMIFEGFM